MFCGICTAVITIKYNITMTRKTQTATFLFESRKDVEYVASLHTFKYVHNSGKSFRSFIFPTNGASLTDDEVNQGRKIQYILNFYERVAVSIKSGIYDENMIKKTSYTTVIETFETAEPLIKAIREKIRSDLTYQEYEWLYKRWKRSPLKKGK